MKTCTRCNTIKPAEAFKIRRSLPGGLDPWCKDCANAANREWRRRYPASVAAEKELNTKSYDPSTYSLRVCEHISQYADRAITRFEKRTGQEAPPQLTVLRQLAQKVIDEHPSPRQKRRPTLRCNYCRDPYPVPHRKSERTSLYCKPLCAKRAHEERRAPRHRSSPSDP